MDTLMDRAGLEEVVALVGATTRIEEGEHTCNKQGRLVVRYGIGTGKDTARLTIFAVRVGKEERVSSSEIAELYALADVATIKRTAIVDMTTVGRYKIGHSYIDAYN